MEKKSIHSQDDIKEIAEWFAARRDRLPQTLQLNKATRLPDLPHTVNLLLDLANAQRGNATFDNEVNLLFEIRNRLLALEAEG